MGSMTAQAGVRETSTSAEIKPLAQNLNMMLCITSQAEMNTLQASLKTTQNGSE